MYSDFDLLIYLSQKKGLYSQFISSTLQIAKELKAPQQTISRRFQEIEAKGLITRKASAKGIEIELTAAGRKVLEDKYLLLQQIFKPKSEIKGLVKSGLGEGSYYVSQTHYQDQFEEMLGFRAFPGTLNVQITKEDCLSFISQIKPVVIDSFRTKERTFGSLICYKVRVESKEAAIVVPERTRHEEDIIEIISPENLRQSLKLKDNSKVMIH